MSQLIIKVLLPALLLVSSWADTLWQPAGGTVCEQHKYTLKRQTLHLKLIAKVGVFKRQCQKVEREKISSVHLGTGNPAFQKHPFNRDRHTIRTSWQSTQIHAGSSDSSVLPDELFTVKTEGRLAEESGHELVSVDLVDPTSHGALPLPRKLLVGLLFHYGIVCQQEKKHCRE